MWDATAPEEVEELSDDLRLYDDVSDVVAAVATAWTDREESPP
jgi:hypothetical protein